MRSGGAARPIWMRRFLDGSDRGARSGARGLSLAHKCASLSPSFLWKEVPRRGGGWPRETVLPHSGKPTPPRFARLPLPEEGARMIFQETLIQSLPFAVRDSRSPPHVPRTSPLSSAVFHTASALSATLSPSFLWKEVPRRGGGWPRETVLPHSGKPTPPRFARLPLPEEGA